jgi:hypothetical protein
MSSFGFRPHFSQVLEMTPDEARDLIVLEVRSGGEPCEIKCFPGFICIRVPEDERHFWSPRLNLSLDDNGDGSTRVEGIYGPNANVWSLFLYGYLGVGTIGLFSGALGWAQHSLGKTAWGLWICTAMATLGVGLYLLAQFGQKIGAEQMFQLKRIYETAIGRTTRLH